MVVQEKDMAEYIILKGNLAIWELMGSDPSCPPVRCAYHYSWDSLKPVVDEISKHWVDDFCPADKVCSMLIVSPIDKVWKACVEFAETFNKNK